MQAGGVIRELNVPHPGIIRAEDIVSAGIQTGQRRHNSRSLSLASAGTLQARPFAISDDGRALGRTVSPQPERL